MYRIIFSKKNMYESIALCRDSFPHQADCVLFISAAMDSNVPSAFEAAAQGDNVLEMDAPKSDDDW